MRKFGPEWIPLAEFLATVCTTEEERTRIWNGTIDALNATIAEALAQGAETVTIEQIVVKKLDRPGQAEVHVDGTARGHGWQIGFEPEEVKA